MTDRVAIVTGGLRGLGRSMTLGLARTGVKVLAVGHIDSDVPSMTGIANVHPFVGDIRKPEGCDRIVAEALKVFGRVDILVNNAGLTFTTIEPDRYRRDQRQKFWEVPDGVIQAVMDTNYVGSDQMARRVAPLLVAQGWGRIVNVTTKLSTMNVPGAMPYGASKAALEMATEVWAKELAGTGVTANIVNPGAGANTPGMAVEMRERSAAGTAPRLVEPDEMVPPLLFVVSAAADRVNGYRFDANNWDASLSPAAAAKVGGRPAGFELHPRDENNGPLG